MGKMQITLGDKTREEDREVGRDRKNEGTTGVQR